MLMNAFVHGPVDVPIDAAMGTLQLAVIVPSVGRRPKRFTIHDCDWPVGVATLEQKNGKQERLELQHRNCPIDYSPLPSPIDGVPQCGFLEDSLHE